MNLDYLFRKILISFLYVKDVVKTLGEVRADPNTAVPRKRVKIIDCGLNELSKKYDLSEEDLDSEKDL